MIYLLILILFVASFAYAQHRIEGNTPSPSLPKFSFVKAVPVVCPESDVRIHYPKQLRTKRAHRERCLIVELPPAHTQHVTKKDIQAWLQSVREVDQIRNMLST